MDDKPSGSADFTEIHAILRAVSERQAAFDRLLQEQKAENDRRAEENDRRAEENDRRAEENDRRIEENDRLLKEDKEKFRQYVAETDRRIAENDRRAEENDRRIAENNRLLKQNEESLRRHIRDNKKRMNQLDYLFTSQWGKLVESLVEGGLVELLCEQGIRVRATYSRVGGDRQDAPHEYDLVAVNGTEAVVVEVKTTLHSPDVQHFLGKLEEFKDYEGYSFFSSGRRILGGVAYLRAEQASVRMAEKRGLYVIRATGNSARIVNGPDFEPRVFG